jgi:hypothetical protein
MKADAFPNTRRATRRWPLALGAALLLHGFAACAEGPVQALNLSPSTRFAHAKSAVAQGTAGAEPQRYSVAQTNILQPVSVTLIAPASSGLKLVLSKVAAEPLRQATVGPQGMANLKFCTEGGFLAAVHGTAKPVPYHLLVLVGEEEKRKLPSIVVPMSSFQGGATKATGVTPAGDGASGAAVPWFWLVGGGAFAVFGLGAVLWAVRRRAST